MRNLYTTAPSSSKALASRRTASNGSIRYDTIREWRKGGREETNSTHGPDLESPRELAGLNGFENVVDVRGTGGCIRRRWTHSSVPCAKRGRTMQWVTAGAAGAGGGYCGVSECWGGANEFLRRCEHNGRTGDICLAALSENDQRARRSIRKAHVGGDSMKRPMYISPIMIIVLKIWAFQGGKVGKSQLLTSLRGD